MRRSQPGFDLKAELKNPEMRRPMQLPGMRVRDAYRLAHYDENPAHHGTGCGAGGVVERIQQRRAAAEKRPPPRRRRSGAARGRPTPAQREALNAVCCTVHRSNCLYFTRERKNEHEQEF